MLGAAELRLLQPGMRELLMIAAKIEAIAVIYKILRLLLGLHQERCGASRILIAACPEGLGRHGLFPYLNGPRFERQRHLLRRLSVVKTRTLPAKTVHLAPFVDDPFRARFQEQATTEYSFVFSDAVPGGIYQASAVVPGPAAGAAPMSRRTLTIEETP